MTSYVFDWFLGLYDMVFRFCLHVWHSNVGDVSNYLLVVVLNTSSERKMNTRLSVEVFR